VLRDQALKLMLTSRGAAIILVTEGDTSMVPYLRGGDAVLAVPLVAAPGLGDLLLYRQNDYWVVHRCLGRAVSRNGREGLRTRGDGRNALDPFLPPEAVLARVSAIRRSGLWHSLETRTARAYAQLLAWHDLFWAVAGVAARMVSLGRAVAGLDLLSLRLLVPLTFRLFHRQIARPAVSGPDEAV
jgi:hypothetical protein